MDYKPLIDKTIESLINQFHRKPHNFFNEHEFHAYCYHRFYRQKEFSKQYTTLDGRKTNILKPEYPSIKRFSRERLEVLRKEGSRGHYDLAFLNPKFIQNFKYYVVRNKNITYSHDGPDNLIAVIEFKYVTSHDCNFNHEVKYDLLKLGVANEAKNKYFLMFVNAPGKERDYFKEVTIPVDVNIRYVRIWEENGKKMFKDIDKTKVKGD